MANCIRCGRQLPPLTWKKICQWCVQHERSQRGEDAEVQTVMPAPWAARRTESTITLTHVIFGVCVALFVAMVAASSGVDFPGKVMEHFGANFGPETLSGDWWRLVGSKAAVTDEIVDVLQRFRLADVMHQRTAVLPYGKQRLLEIALAFACRPHVLLLDEPAAGVPEAERQELLATIAELPTEVTVLLIEHDMDLVFSFADRISVLVNGGLFVDGAPEEVARDPRVKAVYLGEELDA